MRKKQVTFHFTQEEITFLRRGSKKKQISMNELLRDLIKIAMNEEKKKGEKSNEKPVTGI